MPTILSLSSQVAYGHVGHSVAVFTWQRMGIDVIALPTILLSNRPDYPRRAGMLVEPAKIHAMFEALDANGWLSKIDAIFAGYMPSVAHVLTASTWITELKARNPALIICCDPILGDEPAGLYIPEDVALAIRGTLLPLSDILTPNSFELGWLSGMPVSSGREAASAAEKLAPTVLTTSLSAGPDTLANFLHCREGSWSTCVRRRANVAHGSGDMMAALFLGHYLRTGAFVDALALATGGVEAVIDASTMADELKLVESQERWAMPERWVIHAGVDIPIRCYPD
jgi:pyridoxine kinase